MLNTQYCFHILAFKHKLADALSQWGPNYLHFQAKMINGPCHNLLFPFFVRSADDERPGAPHPPIWSRPLGPSVPPVVPRALPALGFNNWLRPRPPALISTGSSSRRQPGHGGQRSGSWLLTRVGVGRVLALAHTKQMQVISELRQACCGSNSPMLRLHFYYSEVYVLWMLRSFAAVWQIRTSARTRSAVGY